MVVVHISRNVKHPCFEVALSAKEVTVLQYPEENILHQIFTQLSIPVHAIEKAKQRLFIALEKQAKPVEVAIFYLEHQGVVVECFQKWIRYFQAGKPRVR
jgi:hypothetical protein